MNDNMCFLIKMRICEKSYVILEMEKFYVLLDYYIAMKIHGYGTDTAEFFQEKALKLYNILQSSSNSRIFSTYYKPYLGITLFNNITSACVGMFCRRRTPPAGEKPQTARAVFEQEREEIKNKITCKKRDG
jgi:hypothetical protein